MDEVSESVTAWGAPAGSRDFLATGGEMGAMMRAHDWSTSPLGPPEHWPAILKTTVAMMLPAAVQIVLFWGPDFVALYNDSYAPTIGDKHPRALGRPACENWSELWDDLEPLLRRVLDRGETVAAEDRPFYIERHGRPETVYFDISYSPVRDEDGGIAGVLCLVKETTEKVLSSRQLHESEKRFHAMADSVDQMIWSTQPDGFHDYYNQRWYDYTGVPEGSTDGEAWNGMFHPEDQDRAWGVWRHSLETGEPYHIEYRLRHRSGQYRWVLGRAHPVRDAKGAIERWYGTCTDIDDLKSAEEALRESEEFNRRILASSNDCIKVLSLDAHLESMSPGGLDVMEIDDFGAIRGAYWPDLWGEAERPLVEAAVEDALAGRIGRFEGFCYTGRGTLKRWDVIVSAIAGEDGRPEKLLSISRDISAQYRANEAIRESEARFRAMADSAPVPVWVTGRDGIEFVNQAFAEFFGLSPEELSGDTWMKLTHPDDLADARAEREGAWDRAESYRFEARFRRADGEWRWMQVVSRPRFETDGALLGYVGVATDMTEVRSTEAALREQGRTLETLNRTGAAVAAELDLGKLIQMVTDAGVELTGAQFGAFFYNVINDAGESYMLYTLSGAEPSQFDFGMPRSTAVFHPTFAGEGVVRSDDITKDPRYGKNDPHFGMPKGHLPVRSYLAVSVMSRSGDVIGGLFFGHQEPGRFSERHEQLMTGIAAQAAIGIDNARLFQAVQRELASRERADRALRMLNETLEQRVVDELDRRVQAEEALRQVQKMETLGQLTGGVAHDFNNLLQIVTGNLELIQRGLPADAARLRRAVDNAARGADRAAILTQRLLAFSRRQPLAPKRIDPSRLVTGMSELLHRTLGEMIEVETVLAQEAWPVEADPNQLENAILNLAVNGRDAMPEGGRITIETRNTHLDGGESARIPEATPGDYVCIAVSDTGSGMDEDTVARAFEPFFTTKEVGKGTGLGLSMVYGFVKQSGGHLKIDSAVGSGTSVKIYLPRMAGEADRAEEADDALAPEAVENETILVCEDDEDVRAYTVEVLRELGYRVIEAPDGPSALREIEAHEGKIDLLFTDVVLPSGMTGAMLAREAQARRPGLKVLFTTGYARDAIVHDGRLDPGVELITKPFSYTDLAARLRDLLDEK